VYYAHTHGEDKVLLYYINMEWKEGWHGETQFYSDDLKEVKYTSPYTPGRLILFDGKIPHTMRPQSIIAPKFRFSLSMFLKKG
jgi:Rps23 Pro-64 3,4-dihydroxylase Tpa1-like proline 4-hydroxylase